MKVLIRGGGTGLNFSVHLDGGGDNPRGLLYLIGLWESR